MASELFDLLVRLTLAASCAMAAVLLLRACLRRLAGSSAAYQCWLMVPLAMAAAALPQLTVAPALVMAVAPPAASALVAAAVPLATDWARWAIAAWSCGALATLALFVLSQHAYVRSLGPMTEQGQGQGGIVCAERAQGPLLLGLWRPRIVVPADFTVRYTAQEQHLIIEHERMHAARRDPLANAFLAMLQCLFWFNPLMHYAAARCRFDQELACDAAVMAAHAGQRQAYAAAMLKTQSAGAPALATCHWQSRHPLKERLMQLQQTTPGAARRLAGRAIVTLLACAGMLTAVAVRASAPAASQSYTIAVDLNGRASPTRLLVKQGEHIKWGWADAAGTAPSASEFVVTDAGPDAVYVKMKVTQGGEVVAAPKVLIKLGQRADLAVGEAGTPGALRMGVTVTRAPAAGAAT